MARKRPIFKNAKVATYRTFDGKRYRLLARSKTKREAQLRAARLRKAGRLARVSKTKTGYYVYVRNK